MSQLLEQSCNLAGESRLFTGLAQLGSVGPNPQLGSAQKKNRAGSGGSTPGWLQLLEFLQH